MEETNLDNLKILWIPIDKSWFQMIASGEKKEEYRSTSDYWHSRLMNKPYFFAPNGLFKKFDAIGFRNGYSKNNPTLIMEFKGIRVGKPNMSWGGFLFFEEGQANVDDCFIISIGKELKRLNF